MGGKFKKRIEQPMDAEALSRIIADLRATADTLESGRNVRGTLKRLRGKAVGWLEWAEQGIDCGNRADDA